MDPYLQWDEKALLWINAHHYPWLDAILAPVSYAGEAGALWIVVCLVLLAIGGPNYRRTALTLALTMILVDRLIAAPLGLLFDRQRPYLALPEVRQMGIAWSSSSLPSGHAHSVWIATVVLGSQWRSFLIPLIVFAVLTCYSRPYFGMHYPLDVVSGSALGLMAGFSAVRIERFWRGRIKEKTP